MILVISDNRSRKRGRPCASCPLMSVDSILKSSTKGNCFDLPSVDCKTRNVIYCANCFLYNKQYVGKFSSKLQKRISGHMSHHSGPRRGSGYNRPLLGHFVVSGDVSWSIFAQKDV